MDWQVSPDLTRYVEPEHVDVGEGADMVEEVIEVVDRGIPVIWQLEVMDA
jgi:hypothetical protein